MNNARGSEVAQETETNIDAEEIRQELDRILSSRIFSTARRSRMFLQYVVERSLANSAPKEFEVAVDVLERGADYDPDVDATVRVEASRLRHRLREYYDTAGRTDPILIDIPKGGYGAVFSSRERNAYSSVSDAARSQEQSNASGSGFNGTQVSGSPAVELNLSEAQFPAGQSTESAWRVGAAVAVTAIAAVVVIGLWLAKRPPQTAGPIRSLAVLPLQNLSRNANEEYFADGMTDALITELAHIPNLRVVSRTSIMQEKGNKKPLRQIASELDVDAVVEGSVVRSGDRVRITAQLIDARDDRHLWAQSYEEQMTDILALQDKLVREIALQTQAALSPSREKLLSGRINPAAYDLYLRGLYFLNQREIDRSVSYLQQAVATDASYAPAYAGLAEALTTQGASGGSAHPDEQSRALAAAKRAIELDPGSGEAYAALGLVEINYGKNWAAAGRDLEKAIALSPGDSLAEMNYSIYLDAMGRPEDAVTHMRRALRLDPRSFLMNRQMGAVLYYARYYDEALTYLERAVEIEPSRFGYAQQWITYTYEMTRRSDDAERSDLLKLGIRIPAAKLAPLRLAYQRGGWKAYQAARIELITEQPESGCDLYEVGESYLRLGDKARAFSWLARGIEAGCYWADSVPVQPLLDSIRSDPRFPALLQLAHLQEPRT
jgi:TolB-like protein/Flp pilus assembly protein TadD